MFTRAWVATEAGRGLLELELWVVVKLSWVLATELFPLLAASTLNHWANMFQP